MGEMRIFVSGRKDEMRDIELASFNLRLEKGMQWGSIEQVAKMVLQGRMWLVDGKSYVINCVTVVVWDEPGKVKSEFVANLPVHEFMPNPRPMDGWHVKFFQEPVEVNLYNFFNRDESTRSTALDVLAEIEKDNGAPLTAAQITKNLVEAFLVSGKDGSNIGMSQVIGMWSKGDQFLKRIGGSMFSVLALREK